MKQSIIYRKIIKLSASASGMLATIQTYFYNKRAITQDVNVLYIDGLVSVNSKSNVLPVENDIKNLYSPLYQDVEALKIIQSLNLQEKDVFLGREGIYILFKNSEDKITIKNSTTDLKTILTQNIAIDNAFFASLSTALATNNYTQFKASLSPTIAEYISQKNTINALILSLLK